MDPTTTTLWSANNTLLGPHSFTVLNVAHIMNSTFVNFAVLDKLLPMVSQICGIYILFELTLWLAHVVWKWAFPKTLVFYGEDGRMNSAGDQFFNAREF